MREGKTSTSNRTEGYGIKDLVSPVWCLQHQLTADTEGEPKKTVPLLRLTPPAMLSTLKNLCLRDLFVHT